MQAIELEVNITDTHEIHLKLPDEVTATTARVIVMYEDNGVENATHKRVFGQYRGKITISETFDDELPTEFWLGKQA